MSGSNGVPAKTSGSRARKRPRAVRDSGTQAWGVTSPGPISSSSARRSVSSIDLRYHRTAIASHSEQTHEAMTVANVARLREKLYEQLPEVEVIGIDEGQFFDQSIVQLVGELVHLGKRILIAGLDTTFTGDPFGPIPALMAIADEVTKLSAVCIVCGAPAIHTQRLGSSRELVVVGAAGIYEARCRNCFRPYLEAPEEQQ